MWTFDFLLLSKIYRWKCHKKYIFTQYATRLVEFEIKRALIKNMYRIDVP